MLAHGWGCKQVTDVCPVLGVQQTPALEAAELQCLELSSFGGFAACATGSAALIRQFLCT